MRQTTDRKARMRTRVRQEGILLVCAMLLLVGWAEASRALEGRVIGVIDGDTLTILLADRHPVRVRLAGIDAPEKGQAFGTRAKQSLAELAFGKVVRVEVLDQDRYGRVVGRVFVGRVDVNREQVRRGLAWVYRRYSHDEHDLVVEGEARRARRGLWADETPVPPWEWRGVRRRVAAP